jgi:hypothetical protein
MRTVILELLKNTEECAYSSHYPNEQTVKVLNEIEKGKNLVGAIFLKKLLRK